MLDVKEIKRAVDEGYDVKWKTGAYDVIKDSMGEYLIRCNINGHVIGLTHRDEVTLNGDPKDFYVEEDITLSGESVKERIADTLLDYMAELNLDRLIELLLNAGFSRQDLLNNGFDEQDVDRVKNLMEKGEDIG